MLATRPSSSQQEGAAAAAAAAAASSSQEEKSIPGVSRDALKEERKPLLDLDDVEQLESELAACFDAPPPPPLNIRREEPVANVSSWTPAAEPRYVETVVPRPTPAEVAAAQARGELPRPQQEQELGQQEQEPQQQLQATRVSDFSSLYSATPRRGESVGQLYPALVPSAPSSEAMRIPQPHSTAASAAPAATAASSAMVPVSVASAGVEAVRAARERGEEVGSSGEVVEELLSENERLRLIIQEMSEELDRVSVRAGGGATAAAAAARQAPSQEQRVTTTSATPAQRLLGRYPGAQAEAARRQREREQQQQSQSQQQQGQAETQTQPQTLENVRPGQFVHFKCDNCPQWLKVPGHAQLVYCPLCGHTSHVTSSSTIHVPPNSETQSNSGRGSGAGGATSGQEEEVGWIGYFKSIIAS